MSNTKLNEEFKSTFYKLFSVSLSLVRDRIENERFILEFNQYPRVGTFSNGLPQFGEEFFGSSGNAPKKYSNVLEKDQGNLEDHPKWKNLIQIVKDDEMLLNFFNIQDDVDNLLELQLFLTFSEMLDYYILESNVFSLNKKRFEKIFSRFEAMVTQEQLEIFICIPLPLIKFPRDKIKLNSNIWIERISDKFQLARNPVNFQNKNHQLILGASTHQIVIYGYTLKNPRNKWEISRILNDSNAFEEPILIGENLVTAIRINTSFSTGLAQILSVPNNWGESYKGPLQSIYKINLFAYNRQLEDFGWHLDQTISLQQISAIVSDFNSIMNINDNGFKFAINRYNDYFLRRNERDQIMDIASALESLLTQDSHSEITYRLANRASILAKKYSLNGLSPEEIQKQLKKIYNYRSSVVHGNSKNLEKKRIIQLEDETTTTAISLAHDILEGVLKIFIKQGRVLPPAEIDTLLF